jgi:hypothetical protein
MFGTHGGSTELSGRKDGQPQRRAELARAVRRRRQLTLRVCCGCCRATEGQEGKGEGGAEHGGAGQRGGRQREGLLWQEAGVMGSAYFRV